MSAPDHEYVDVCGGVIVVNVGALGVSAGAATNHVQSVRHDNGDHGGGDHDDARAHA